MKNDKARALPVTSKPHIFCNFLSQAEFFCAWRLTCVMWQGVILDAEAWRMFRVKVVPVWTHDFLSAKVGCPLSKWIRWGFFWEDPDSWEVGGGLKIVPVFFGAQQLTAQSPPELDQFLPLQTWAAGAAGRFTTTTRTRNPRKWLEKPMRRWLQSAAKWQSRRGGISRIWNDIKKLCAELNNSVLKKETLMCSVCRQNKRKGEGRARELVNNSNNKSVRLNNAWLRNFRENVTTYKRPRLRSGKGWSETIQSRPSFRSTSTKWVRMHRLMLLETALWTWPCLEIREPERVHWSKSSWNTLESTCLRTRCLKSPWKVMARFCPHDFHWRNWVKSLCGISPAKELRRFLPWHISATWAWNTSMPSASSRMVVGLKGMTTFWQPSTMQAFDVSLSEAKWILPLMLEWRTRDGA